MTVPTCGSKLAGECIRDETGSMEYQHHIPAILCIEIDEEELHAATYRVMIKQMNHSWPGIGGPTNEQQPPEDLNSIAESGVLVVSSCLPLTEA